MRRALPRGQRPDPGRAIARVGVVVKAGRRQRLVACVDRDDRARRPIVRERAGPGEVDLLAEVGGSFAVPSPSTFPFTSTAAARTPLVPRSIPMTKPRMRLY